ncbi:rab-like protein 2A isoform X6 [Notamacropus eugenii]|uniref:rab-like protein 2A isoform X6 n=1 Tax=Notamacropus eugenii TaxID=9315 RepID=UPI003B66FD5A
MPRPGRHGRGARWGRGRGQRGAGAGPGEVRRGRERQDHLPRGQRRGLMERFLMDGFRPQQLSTYALTLYKYTTTVDDFWDTAGQERFQSMHASYYHKAHACIMVFDVQRKVTYKNLSTWYSELREFRPEIPCVVVANKIDADANVTQKSFNFARRFSLPLYFVSAADGTNVVKLFNDAIRLAVSYKQNSQDFMDEVLQELENFELEKKVGSKLDPRQSEAFGNLTSP